MTLHDRDCEQEEEQVDRGLRHPSNSVVSLDDGC